MLKSTFFTIALPLLCLTSLQAQLPPLALCQNPMNPGAVQCRLACVDCNIDGVEDLIPFPLGPGGPQTVCSGTMDMYSPRWYSFIAGTPTIMFEITPFDWKTTGALVGIGTENCEVDKPIICIPAFPGQKISSIQIPMFGMTVGKVYQIGVGGAVDSTQTKYTISVVSGSATPPPLGPMTPIDGPTDLCPRAEANYSIAPVSGALSYTWTAPPGSSIDGGPNVRSYQPPLGTNVHIKFGATPGNICVRASTYCHPPVQRCTTVTITPIPVTVLPDLFFCMEETPFTWPEPPNYEIGIPGTFTLTSTPLTSYLGCDSIVRQRVTVSPIKIQNLGLRYLCATECMTVGDQQYCNEGDYEVHIPATNNCDSTIFFRIRKVFADAVIQPPSTLTCVTNSITLTSNGSTTGPGVTYQWLNGSLATIGNGPSVTVSAIGNYYLIVSNTIGTKTCRDTAAIFVPSSNTVPLADAGPQRTITCAAPVVTLSGNASTGPNFNYFWTASNGGNITGGINTLTPTVNQSGTYTLLVTNTGNGCTSTSLTNVLSNTTPPGVAATGGTYTCSQPTTNIAASSPNAGATFLWSGPNGFSSTATNVTVSTAGFYSVTATDNSNGCSSVATAEVVANTAPPGASATGGELTCTTLAVAVNGNSPSQNVSYAWTGPNGFSSNQQSPTVNTSGQYDLVVTGTNGCVSTASTNVGLNNTPPGGNVSVSGALNCNNSSVSLIANPTGGTNYNFNWQNPDGSTTSTGGTPLLPTSTPGQYILQITNTANGCTATATASVEQRSPVGIASQTTDDVNCNGGQDGSATVAGSGGLPPYSYAWSTGGNSGTISGLTVGAYVATVTDAEGCTTTTTATVAQPDPVDANATATAETANDANDGTATANPTGGVSPFTYEWENSATTQTISNLAPGAYTVTVTDANNCTDVQTVNVNAFECQLEVGIQTENVSCFGNNDGSATVTANNTTGAVTFNWSHGVSGQIVSNLAPGQYVVSILDGANCAAELTFEITQPTQLEPNATAQNASGGNLNNGSATANPTGGVPPYTYLWTTGATTQTITGLSPGFYTVAVTDANDCNAVHVVEVGEDNCGLSADFVIENPSCAGLNDGSAILVLTGGTAPFNYLWSNGSDSTSTVGGAGTYTVSVTDVNGCEIFFQTILTNPPALTIEVASTTSTVCPTNDPSGSATVSSTGGTGNVSYSWSNGQTGPTATGLVAGTYTAAATDANGCEISTVVTVASNDTVAPTLAAPPMTLSLGSAGEIVLDAQNTGIQADDNCQVTDIKFSPAKFKCNEQGDHLVTVTVTDASGNVTSITTTYTVTDNSAPEMECPASIIRCFGDNVVAYQPPTAEDNCQTTGGTFSLDAGLPSGSQFPVGTTVNTYSFTDAGGNVGSCSFEVTVLTQLSVVTNKVVHDIANQGIGSIDITVTGSLPPYSYQWTKDGAPFATTEDLSGLFAGDYKVVVKDANNCTVTTLNIKIDNLVGAQEPSWAGAFSLIPNPTSGAIAAIFPTTMQDDIQIHVFDATGRRVFAENFAFQQRIDLDLSHLADGLYAVQVQVGKERLGRKLVISR